MKKAIITIASLIAGAIMVDKFITWNNQQKTDEVSASTNEDSLWTKSWLKVDEWTSGKKNPTASKVDLREFLKGDSGLSLLEEFKRSGWQLKYADNDNRDLYLDGEASNDEKVVFVILEAFKDTINNKTTLNEWEFTFHKEDDLLIMNMTVSAYSELNTSLPRVLSEIEQFFSVAANEKTLLNKYVGAGYKTSVSGRPAWRVEYRHKRSADAGEIHSESDKGGIFDFVRSEKLMYKPIR